MPSALQQYVQAQCLSRGHFLRLLRGRSLALLLQPPLLLAAVT
jgi:hypothetical protein